ncbi:MAG: HAD-IA family hydrolase [Burkholderiales bacterium]
MNAADLFWRRPVLVFDLDGTLVHTLPDLTDALNQALADEGQGQVSEALVRGSLHGGLEGSVDAAIDHLGLAPDCRARLVDRYAGCYAQSIAARSEPYPGVQPVLARLRERGVRLAVCTNKLQAQAVKLLDALGLLASFELVVGADTCAQRKPSPVPLLHAVTALGAETHQALLVGDSAVDAACASGAEVPCLLFSGGYGFAVPGANTGVASFASWWSLLHAEPLPASGV